MLLRRRRCVLVKTLDWIGHDACPLQAKIDCFLSKYKSNWASVCTAFFCIQIRLSCPQTQHVRKPFLFKGLLNLSPQQPSQEITFDLANYSDDPVTYQWKMQVGSKELAVQGC